MSYGEVGYLEEKNNHLRPTYLRVRRIGDFGKNVKLAMMVQNSSGFSLEHVHLDIHGCLSHNYSHIALHFLKPHSYQRQIKLQVPSFYDKHSASGRDFWNCIERVSLLSMCSKGTGRAGKQSSPCACIHFLLLFISRHDHSCFNTMAMLFMHICSCSLLILKEDVVWVNICCI